MLTISKPLSSGQAQRYHAREFTSPEQAYYSQEGEVVGAWHGRLADEWGLTGAVTALEFGRLAEGQHPVTGAQLVRHRQAFLSTTAAGERIRTMEHRAAWDATFSAPKSVSLTALVGGDERVHDAHRAAVGVALGELEQVVQARIGGTHPAETTGKWIAATFEHDASRPVDGYAAPQLHTHVVIFNMTELSGGRLHALQPRELYRRQSYATAVYQAELGARLRTLGYELEPGKNGAPEIRGYSAAYLEASSPRRRQILAHLQAHGFDGAGAAQIAAHHTRDAKAAVSSREIRAQHQALAATFGHQPERVVEGARGREMRPSVEEREQRARQAVSYARAAHLEREAVVDEWALLREALKRGIGAVTLSDVRANVERRVQAGDLIAIRPDRPDATGRVFTTPEMLAAERDVIAQMQAGRGRYAALVPDAVQNVLADRVARLTPSQRAAIGAIVTSRDRVMGLQGTAGAGKTTALAVLRDAAERARYRVEGLAPASRAAQQLEEAGIRASTLQHLLAQGPPAAGDGAPHLYVLDESSLASTTQITALLHRLRPHDRVLLVGDTRQHEAVEAGRPFEQLQQAGMLTARLDEILRQRDPTLKAVVEALARGEVESALARLTEAGRVHEIIDSEARLAAVARAYARHPKQTLVISPDNASRVDLNHRIRRELQARGLVATTDHRLTVLVPRGELTGADRRWAARYDVGDRIRYTRGSRALGLRAGEYARVVDVDREQNFLTVDRTGGARRTYDPRRLHGVSVYREASRDFSVGDRVQFTAPDRAARIANRQLGTIEQVDGAGTLAIRLDSGRAVQVSSRAPRHLDHGYAVTSHSSQGATAERVLLHIDTGTAHAPLLNRRLAYVAISRARAEAEIYTNDAPTLGRALGREVTKSTALEVVKDHAPAAPEPATRRGHEVGRQRTLAAAPLRPHRPAVSREQAWDREL